MLAGALLLISQPAAGAALPLSPESPACPALSIPFAPPLDASLQLTRTIERELAQGTFAQTVTYAVSFTRSGRGYRMRWQQTAQHSDGPPELLRLLSLQEESAAGEVLDFTLDESGALLGVSESPDSPERLARAIARLRADPALTERPARERTAITAMLDRLATLPASERAAVHMASASRLLMFAGRPCAAGQVATTDNSIFRIAAVTGESAVFKGFTQASRPDGASLVTSITATLSLATGLIESQDRRTTTQVAGTTRWSRESLVLQLPEPGPKSAR